jgi:hypothetical protein
MMDEVVLDRDYRCAPEGHTTYVFFRGQRVSGRVAEMALRDGFAKRPVVPKQTKPAQPRITKAPPEDE